MPETSAILSVYDKVARDDVDLNKNFKSCWDTV